MEMALLWALSIIRGRGPSRGGFWLLRGCYVVDVESPCEDVEDVLAIGAQIEENVGFCVGAGNGTVVVVGDCYESRGPSHNGSCMLWASPLVTFPNAHIGAIPIANATAKILFDLGPYSLDISSALTNDFLIAHIAIYNISDVGAYSKVIPNANIWSLPVATTASPTWAPSPR